jgi:hypothetical protein
LIYLLYFLALSLDALVRVFLCAQFVTAIRTMSVSRCIFLNGVDFKAAVYDGSYHDVDSGLLKVLSEINLLIVKVILSGLFLRGLD